MRRRLPSASSGDRAARTGRRSTTPLRDRASSTCVASASAQPHHERDASTGIGADRRDHPLAARSAATTPRRASSSAGRRPSREERAQARRRRRAPRPDVVILERDAVRWRKRSTRVVSHRAPPLPDDAPGGSIARARATGARSRTAARRAARDGRGSLGAGRGSRAGPAVAPSPSGHAHVHDAFPSTAYARRWPCAASSGTTSSRRSASSRDRRPAIARCGGSRSRSAQSSLLRSNVRSSFGSGIAARAAGSRKAREARELARRPAVTAARARRRNRRRTGTASCGELLAHEQQRRRGASSTQAIARAAQRGARRARRCARRTRGCRPGRGSAGS